jgi:hypothetical protein
MSDIKDRGWRNFDGKERSIWKDLAPEITRQRLIIEGTLHKSFESENMVKNTGGVHTCTGKSLVCMFILGT